jgi:hypothetical protein
MIVYQLLNGTKINKVNTAGIKEKKFQVHHVHLKKKFGMILIMLKTQTAKGGKK